MNSTYVKGTLGFAGEDQFGMTPVALYEYLDKEFHFDFDPCPVNPTFDGLTRSWGHSNYVNPPYNDISAWYAKALKERESHIEPTTSVFLIPFRPHTKYFKELIFPTCSEIRFFRKRFAFQGYIKPAFSVCVIVLAPANGVIPPAISNARESPFNILSLHRSGVPLVECRTVKALFERVAPLLELSSLVKVTSEHHAKECFESLTQAGTLIISNFTPAAVIRTASAFHDKTGYPVAVVIPFRPDGAYFLDMVMFGKAAHVLAVSPNLIMDGYVTPSPTGSVIIVFTRTPNKSLYATRLPRFSVIDEDFHVKLKKPKLITEQDQ